MDSDLVKTRSWLQHYDADVPFSLRYPSGPVTNLLYHAANYQTNQAATWFYGTEMTFGELYTKSTQMANSLMKLGIQKGDRVGLQLPSSPQFCVAYWAILITGGIVVNLNPAYFLNDLVFITKDIGLKGIITFDEALPAIMELDTMVEIPIKVMALINRAVMTEPNRSAVEVVCKDGWHSFEHLIDKGQMIPPRVTIESDDPAIIQFTGGIGVGEGVVLTHRNVMAASLGKTYWEKGIYNHLPPERRVELCTIPFSHIYGEIYCVNYSVTTFHTLVIVPQFDVEQVFDVARSFAEFSYWPCDSAMLRSIFSHTRFAEISDKLAHISIGEVPLPLDLAGQAEKMHISVSQGWGICESTAYGIGSPCLGRKKAGSIGIPNIDGEVKIVDTEMGRELSAGKLGEILLRGPYVIKGYWRNPEKTARQLLPDGWLRTGSLGYIDEEGYIFIVGRVNNAF